MPQDPSHRSLPFLRESLLLAAPDASTLCLTRLRRDCGAATPVFMLHGAIENGRIFYAPKSLKGLAYYMAAAGFDVFIGDLRGRGSSYPRISRGAAYGQTEAICEDIPRFMNAITALYPSTPQIWLAHSWGGVLMSSFLARFPAARAQVSHCVYFAAKRSVGVHNPERWLFVDFLWKTLCPLVAWGAGYLPAKGLRLGADNETRRSLAQSVAWVKCRPWIDPGDGFDYGAALAATHPSSSPPLHPPTLLLTGSHDRSLGHAADVARFQRELGQAATSLYVLGTKAPAERAHVDYDHINILTHPLAVDDHFPRVINWLRTGQF